MSEAVADADEAPEGGPRSGDVVAEKYEIISLIGEGGMGRVFAAKNQRTGKRVALKWISVTSAERAEALARFQREARATGRIDHPNVITIYDVVDDGDDTYLVMELLEGESLEALLAREGTLAAPVAASILVDAARGVAAAHEAGVVHRDLKPANLFLCTGAAGARVKVLDFGVSKLREDTGASLALTKSGVVIGTPYYMAPEQVRAVKDLDERVDVYALGAVLYEMLAGRPPFRGESYSALMVEIATGAYTPLREVARDVPAELEAIVDWALARDRDARVPSVPELGKLLERFGSAEPTEIPAWADRIVAPGEATRSDPVSGHAPTVDARGLESSGERARTAQTVRARGEPLSVPGARKRPTALVAGAIGIVLVSLAGIAVWLAETGSPAPPARREGARESTSVVEPAPEPAPTSDELAPAPEELGDVDPVMDATPTPSPTAMAVPRPRPAVTPTPAMVTAMEEPPPAEVATPEPPALTPAERRARAAEERRAALARDCRATMRRGMAARAVEPDMTRPRAR